MGRRRAGFQPAIFGDSLERLSYIWGFLHPLERHHDFLQTYLPAEIGIIFFGESSMMPLKGCSEVAQEKFQVDKRSHGFSWQRGPLFALGLFILSLIAVLAGALSESTILLADQALTNYWRTTYDILVRPAGTRSSVEVQHGLVEPNFLSNLSGGITISQYEAIKAIPGVEIAAPEGLLTYIGMVVPREQVLPEPKEPGVYFSEQSLITDDGLQVREILHNRCYWGIKPEDLTRGYPPSWKCLGGGLAGALPGVLYPLGFID
ncbi:MAG: hypothetical protein ACK4WK_10915, partial [Anaerolineae bacterium]